MDKLSTKKRLTLLVLRAKAGDREAVDRLLEAHQSELFGYLKKMLRDHSDAEDVLQQTMMQAVKKLRWLREPEYFRPWVFRIASRIAFRIIKQRQRTKEFSNAPFIDGAADLEFGDSETTDLTQQIPEWLERLTPKGREAVILHYLEGFTTEEVAEILNIPLGTAKSRISYSLACIRKHVTHQKDKS